MIHPARFIFSGICVVLALILTLLWGFPERSPRFSAPSVSAKTDRSGVYELAKARILTRVLGHVRTHYVDPKRVDVRKMAEAALRAVQQAVPEVMVRVTKDKKKKVQTIDVVVGSHSKTFSLKRVNDVFELNWKLIDIFRFLQAKLPATSDLEAIEYTAVSGLLETLDPHSMVLTPRMYRDIQVGTKGKFGGLGIVISTRDGMLTVMSVMRDTPADKAGLKSDDRIVQIGEESTINMPLNDAVSRLRGKPGTKVLIWVRRKGVRQLKAYSITREIIRLRSVEHEMLDNRIGYIKIRNFQGNTYADMEKALTALYAKTPKLAGLVLDLRENPGGLLEQAVKISDRFLAKGTIVTTVTESSREREEKQATAKGSLTDVPMVVLINRGSASASEIVAGALKHNDRALIIGSRSYGKGSVQVVYRLDEGALKLTVAQYLTPQDISIQSVGIVPDVSIVPMTVDKANMDLHSDALASRGESTLKSHLTSGKTRTSKAAVELRMLKRKAKKDGEKLDALIKLASRLLVAAPASNRKQALVQAAGFLSKQQKDEDLSLEKSLKEIGLQWESGLTPKKVALKVNLRRVDKSRSKPAKAGQSITLEATVTNKGKRPLFRVAGIVSSAIHTLNGSEMVFGRIDPGQTKRWKITTKLSKSTPLTGDRITLQMWSSHRKLKANATFPIHVTDRAKPVFSHSAQVIDAPTAKGKGGNGNGLIQRGEKISLVVRVKNQGPGRADDVLVSIRNASGEHVYIRKGRQKVGAIPKGSSAQATFDIEIRKPLKQRVVQLKLIVVDRATRTVSHQDLSFQVFPPEFVRAQEAEGFVQVGEAPLTIYSGAHKDSGIMGSTPPGAILERVGTSGTFTQVLWKEKFLGKLENIVGWVPSENLTETESGEDTSAGPKTIMQYQAPSITLAPDLADELITDQKTLTLAGQIHFGKSGKEARRDMYIFVGGDKVFFKSYRSSSESPTFEATIPLKAGSNRIIVVAREGKNHMARKSFRVFRKKVK